MDGERYFVLQDDAMVSMRYARNLAEGRGRVWNPGVERVEGYTNPLWTLYMSLLQLAGLTASKVSLLVQISGALTLAANLLYVRRIAALLSGGNDGVSLSAALLAAFYLPLNNWSLQGMEVGPLTLLVSVAVWMDAVAPAGVIIAWLWWTQPGRRRAVTRLALIPAGCLLVQRRRCGWPTTASGFPIPTT